MGASPDLVAFYAARLDEDEQVAKGLEGATRFIGGEPDFYGVGGPAAAAFWGHFTPARMLADVAAKRAILARHTGDHMCPEPRDPDWTVHEAGQPVVRVYPCGDLRSLAAIYSGHPDYDPAWAPSGSPVPDRHHEDEQQQQAHGSGHGERPI